MHCHCITVLHALHTDGISRLLLSLDCAGRSGRSGLEQLQHLVERGLRGLLHVCRRGLCPARCFARLARGSVLVVGLVERGALLVIRRGLRARCLLASLQLSLVDPVLQVLVGRRGSELLHAALDGHVGRGASLGHTLLKLRGLRPAALARRVVLEVDGALAELRVLLLAGAPASLLHIVRRGVAQHPKVRCRPECAVGH
eukprot:scaffold92729_cov66-Phaeocystis_antarctica.AAC.2